MPPSGGRGSVDDKGTGMNTTRASIAAAGLALAGATVVTATQHEERRVVPDPAAVNALLVSDAGGALPGPVAARLLEGDAPTAPTQARIVGRPRCAVTTASLQNCRVRLRTTSKATLLVGHRHLMAPRASCLPATAGRVRIQPV